MKQLKFLMVAFTLLMGVSFTSCLNDDAGESMYDGIGYVRTVMGSYFVDLYGNTYSISILFLKIIYIPYDNIIPIGIPIINDFKP